MALILLRKEGIPSAAMDEKHLDSYLRHLSVERRLSSRTGSSYGYQIRGYLEFLAARRREICSVGREDVLAYLEQRAADGLKDSSLFAATIAIMQFHRFLVARGFAAADPTAGMALPKYRQRIPEPLSAGDMNRLLSLPGHTKFHDVRMRAALELLYSCGMRVSELVGLKLGQVNLQEGWARVAGKGGKERLVPVGPKAKEAMTEYLAARQARFPAAGDTLFLSRTGSPISRTTFWWQLRDLARRAGVSGVFPHKVRHSCATRLLEGGADIRVIQQVLGHSNISTTMIYTHVSVELMRETCRRAHPRF